MVRHADNVRHGQIVDVRSRPDFVMDSLELLVAVVSVPQCPGRPVGGRRAALFVALGEGHVHESYVGELLEPRVDFFQTIRKQFVVVVDFNDVRRQTQSRGLVLHQTDASGMEIAAQRGDAVVLGGDFVAQELEIGVVLGVVDNDPLPVLQGLVLQRVEHAADLVKGVETGREHGNQGTQTAAHERQKHMVDAVRHRFVRRKVGQSQMHPFVGETFRYCARKVRKHLYCFCICLSERDQHSELVRIQLVQLFQRKGGRRRVVVVEGPEAVQVVCFDCRGRSRCPRQTSRDEGFPVL